MHRVTKPRPTTRSKAVSQLRRQFDAATLLSSIQDMTNTATTTAKSTQTVSSTTAKKPCVEVKCSQAKRPLSPSTSQSNNHLPLSDAPQDDVKKAKSTNTRTKKSIAAKTFKTRDSSTHLRKSTTSNTASKQSAVSNFFPRRLTRQAVAWEANHHQAAIEASLISAGLEVPKDLSVTLDNTSATPTDTLCGRNNALSVAWPCH
jgi:hypothetical protein